MKDRGAIGFGGNLSTEQCTVIEKTFDIRFDLLFSQAAEVFKNVYIYYFILYLFFHYFVIICLLLLLHIFYLYCLLLIITYYLYNIFLIN